MSRRLVVFDFDGTLVDTFELYRKKVGEYVALHGLQYPDVEKIRRYYNRATEHDFGFGLPLERQGEHLYGSFGWIDARTMSGEEGMVPDPYAGIHDTLEEIATRGHKLAIVTARDMTSLQYILKHHRLDGFFSAYRTWEDIERRGEASKPAPDQLISVIKEMGSFDAAHTLMVGDTTMDMAMGRAASAMTLGVSWGSHPRGMLEEAGAHHVIDSADEIVPAKNRIFNLES